MIKVDEKNGIFYLNTKSSTYAAALFKNEVLLHLYWGKRLHNPINTNEIYKIYARGLSAIDCDGFFSTNTFPLEYSAFGNSDLRQPTFGAVHSDGSEISKFTYVDYRLVDGKPALKGLPSSYCEDGDKVQTLIIHLCDKLKNIDAYLSYSVFEEFDVITRSVKIVNNGEKTELRTALSASVDFYGMSESELLTLDGAWGRERRITKRKIVHGNQNIESRYGASSAMHNPFMAICEKGADEENGNVYGFSLVYSGSFVAGVEMNAFNCARAYMGISPSNFRFILEKGDEFITPEAVLVFSQNGLGGMSRIYHKFYRTRLCRGKYRDSNRFVLINNWEATYFDFNEEKIVSIAKKAAEIGIDTLVLDDGWFGKRDDDTSGLGDWNVNLTKLPGGLKSLAEKINGLGMHFGLWFEPEMVNPDSDLFRAHPDWILHTKGRKPSLMRNQCTLDLSRDDVCDFIIKSVSDVLESANIEYVKWDMNRYMSEAGSALLPPERQGEVMHRYMLGLYRVFETLTQRFKNVLFEGCASGGGRFDPGILHYMPQIWTSDNSDAEDRLSIQYGTSIVYPFSTMGAHVSACPNHQIGRITPFEMRCAVALPGQFGFELDLNNCTDDEIETARQAVADYKELQDVFHKGECYRLKSPFESDLCVLEFVSEDKKTVIVFIYCKSANIDSCEEFIKLQGLEESAVYSFENEEYGGDYLMNKGILNRNGREHEVKRIILKKV